MNDKIAQYSDKKYSCIKCNYKSDSKRDFDKHLTTSKHKKICNLNDDDTIISQQKEFLCGCGKKYKFRQGLHSHKQKCTFTESNITCGICDIPNKNSTEDLIDDNGDDRNNKIYKALTDNIKDVDDLKNFVVNLIIENAKLKQMNEDLITRITEMIYNNVLANHKKSVGDNNSSNDE